MREIPWLPVIIDGAGGQSGMKDGVLKRYEDTVQQSLYECGRTVVGRAVFWKIWQHGRVLIIPYSKFLKDRFQAGEVNAASLDTGTSIRYGSGSVSRSWGPGILVDALRTNVVTFSPDTFEFIGPASPYFQAAGFRAADVLLHELVHAGRHLGGEARSDAALDGSMARYRNEAEYFAVLIANIHMSEAGRSPPMGVNPPGAAYAGAPRTNIRADHGIGELPAALTLSQAFLAKPENFALVKKYWSQHPNLAPKIAASNASFNPVRTFKEWIPPGYR